MERPNLTVRELEELTDKIIGQLDDPERSLAFMLLIVELEDVALTSPLDVENVTRPPMPYPLPYL